MDSVSPRLHLGKRGRPAGASTWRRPAGQALGGGRRGEQLATIGAWAR
jgi:hypothetical protein